MLVRSLLTECPQVFLLLIDRALSAFLSSSIGGDWNSSKVSSHKPHLKACETVQMWAMWAAPGPHVWEGNHMKGGQQLLLGANPYRWNHFFMWWKILPSRDHSSYHAKVFAIYIACNIFRNRVTYTDCQAALGELVYVIHCIKTHVRPQFCDHGDLCRQVHDVVVKK